MKVGFTGTRKGLSLAQEGQLKTILHAFSRASETTPQLHHGGADGSDTEAHHLAAAYGYAVHVYPAVGHAKAWPGAQVYPAAAPLVRDRVIVERCEVLVAAPETDREQQRSGTWATVRYARAAGKPVVMLSRGAG